MQSATQLSFAHAMTEIENTYALDIVSKYADLRSDACAWPSIVM